MITVDKAVAPFTFNALVLIATVASLGAALQNVESNTDAFLFRLFSKQGTPLLVLGFSLHWCG